MKARLIWDRECLTNEKVNLKERSTTQASKQQKKKERLRKTKNNNCLKGIGKEQGKEKILRKEREEKRKRRRWRRRKEKKKMKMMKKKHKNEKKKREKPEIQEKEGFEEREFGREKEILWKRREHDVFGILSTTNTKAKPQQPTFKARVGWATATTATRTALRKKKREHEEE